LKPGDKWCVCVTRWKSALDHNRAAPVIWKQRMLRRSSSSAGRIKGARGSAGLTKLCRPAAVESIEFAATLRRIEASFSLFLALRY